MHTINTALAQELSMVQRPGDFYATGTVEFLPPRLQVAGVGPVALPLLESQAEQLVAVAERAPYGRGEETLVDTGVRRTWQIDAGRVLIEGKHWARTLESIVARAAGGLGVTVPVAADLYKLLVYDAGSFFVSHRDTEKVPGMFATLVIVLPSTYTGGELLVRHRDREARMELSCPEPSEVAFAAFYADCVHEVLPVTSGCRLTLVYNLRRQDAGSPPEPPDYTAEQCRVADLLRRWCGGQPSPGEAAPEKLIYPLEHAYTPAELGFDALKGADAAVADVLAVAAEQAGCELHLALVSIEESGSAEHTGYGSRRRGRWSDEEEDDEFEVEEVFDRILKLSDWRSPEGGRPGMAEFPFLEAELCPPGAFEDLDPDELEFHEATGNEGASFERTYRRAGLVLWPRARKLAVFNQVGLTATLPYLGQLASGWAEGGEGPESPLWREAHELSGHMLRTWPKEDWRYRWSEAPGESAKMLGALALLKDAERIEAFLAELSAIGVYGKGDNEGLIQAAALLPPPRAAQLIERIVVGNAPERLDACANLLARAASAAQAGGIDLVPAAAALLTALPGVPSAPAEGWRRPPPVEPGCVADLFAALGGIDAALADRAAEHLLAWPATYGLDAVLVPAVLSLADAASSHASAAIQRLRTACLEHLRARIAEPLEPPRDWGRASDIACHCKHCGELGEFLAHPGRKEWIFKAAQAGRDHVTASIKRAGADLDLRTETQGRPYSLVCTKNQASYERRTRQRRKDIDDLARLERFPA